MRHGSCTGSYSDKANGEQVECDQPALEAVSRAGLWNRRSILLVGLPCILRLFHSPGVLLRQAVGSTAQELMFGSGPSPQIAGRRIGAVRERANARRLGIVIADFTAKAKRMAVFTSGSTEAAATSCLGLTSRGRRTSRGSNRGVVCVLGFLAAVCLLFPTLARAIEPSGCPINSDPYGASPAVLQACGTRALPERSTTSMPYGGTQYNYEQPNGQTVSLTVPPASFVAAKASLPWLRIRRRAPRRAR